MGFSGGGSNVLKPHKHSSAVQDGSPLNMNNVTEATLTAGDVIYSDGAALQRLAIGTPAQQIKVNAGATAPEYFTPAAAASAWEELANVSATSGTSITTPVFTPKKYLMIWTHMNASGGMSFRVGNTTLDTGNNYSQSEMYTDGSTVGTGNQTGRSNLECYWNASGGQDFISINTVNIAAQEKVLQCQAYGMQTGGGSPAGGLKNMAGQWHNTSNQIDIVSWYGSTITDANIVVWGRD